MGSVPVAPPPLAVRDSLWSLWRDEDRLSVAQIARRAGRSVRTVQLGLKRARARAREAELNHRVTAGTEKTQHDGKGLNSLGALADSVVKSSSPRRVPRLVPLFPVVPFTPGSACSHHGPIPWGSVLCCMVCHRSGLDGIAPGLQRSPATDPKPDPKPAATKPGKLTRKEKRATEKHGNHGKKRDQHE